MGFLDTLKSVVADPPPALAFEISDAGIASARLGSKTELEFLPLKAGAISVSPLRDNVVDGDELSTAVRSLAPAGANRKRRDVALIVPDYCTRIAVLDFDSFPSDVKEQQSLVRFRMKRSVPFDIDAAAMSYWPQPAQNKKFDVVVAVAPVEIISRYEAPFRAAGMNPGLVTPSGLAALSLVAEPGLSVVAKLSGRILTVMVLAKNVVKLVRCLELGSADIGEVAADLYPTFVYIEDNLGVKAEKLLLCGFGSRTEEARQRFEAELGLAVEAVHSPLGTPGENNAGLLGYLKSVARNN